MQKQTILFNLDDTLVYCNRYFNQVIGTFLEQMSTWFDSISLEEIKQKQMEIDLNAINEFGLISDRFPESFIGTYDYFSGMTGRAKKKQEMDTLRELGTSVFKIPVEPVPYMNETLKLLKNAGHELYLHTGGDIPNQRRKIAQLELTTYFEHRIFISEHKDTTALSDIVKTIRAEPKNTWMVGNSLRTDIKPALDLNLNAIFIPAETEWKFDAIDVDMKPKQAYFTLKSIQEVPDTIQHHILNEVKFKEDLLTKYDSHHQKEDDDNLFPKKSASARLATYGRGPLRLR